MNYSVKHGGMYLLEFDLYSATWTTVESNAQRFTSKAEAEAVAYALGASSIVSFPAGVS